MTDAFKGVLKHICDNCENYYGLKYYNTSDGETRYVYGCIGGIWFNNPTKFNIRIDDCTHYVQKDGVEPELKPCPFCGEEVVVNYYKDSQIYNISCPSLCLMTQTMGYKDKEELIRAWNKRINIE